MPATCRRQPAPARRAGPDWHAATSRLSAHGRRHISRVLLGMSALDHHAGLGWSRLTSRYGSAAPVRCLQMRLFSRVPVPASPGAPRTTAGVGADSLACSANDRFLSGAAVRPEKCHRRLGVGTRSRRTSALRQPNSTGRFRATNSADWLAGPDPLGALGRFGPSVGNATVNRPSACAACGRHPTTREHSKATVDVPQ